MKQLKDGWWFVMSPGVTGGVRIKSGRVVEADSFFEPMKTWSKKAVTDFLIAQDAMPVENFTLLRGKTR